MRMKLFVISFMSTVFNSLISLLLIDLVCCSCSYHSVLGLKGWRSGGILVEIKCLNRKSFKCLNRKV